MKRASFVFLIVTVLSLGFTSGCAKKNKPDTEPAASLPQQQDAQNSAHDSDTNNALGLLTVHFAFDSSELDDAANDVLKKNVELLKNKRQIHVQIEGHCDQRGGIQYNIALGERRAKAVAKLMSIMGIDKSRLTTISMGKEKPIDLGETEEAYAKNRRANFVLTN